MKTFLFFVILFSGINNYAQERKLKLHSISAGIGFASFSPESVGGVAGTMDLAIIFNKNLFSLYFEAGEESLGNLLIILEDQRFTEYNITYGRAFHFNDWLVLEGHAGIGYFKLKTRTLKLNFRGYNTESESTIGVPLRIKLMFYTGDHFGLGINPNVNINSLTSTFTANLMAQYRF